MQGNDVTLLLMEKTKNAIKSFGRHLNFFIAFDFSFEKKNMNNEDCDGNLNFFRIEKRDEEL